MEKSILLSARLLGAAIFFFAGGRAWAGNGALPRERLLMDFGWRFAPGNACDPAKDFGFGTAFFSYFAKVGAGDGPADPKFDDRAWRLLNLPHDWAVEAPFSAKASYSHGYKAVGPGFPASSIGWYRKAFFVPATDKGRRISLEFDGVFRDSIVFLNGFYLGREQGGYNGFHYDITDYLNYGGDNVVAVRVDAGMEEGWFYEGAGIYRHVWLTKTSPLHVAWHGTFVTAKAGKGSAEVTARTTVAEEGDKAASFEIRQEVLDASGKAVARGGRRGLRVSPGESLESSVRLRLARPHLWDLDSPYLYKLVTTVLSKGRVVDRIETPFGVRTILFDPDKGFFLNGRRVELKGTCNHQDFAGVGTALPDALQIFRIRKLKEMGCNAYRCAHNPPTPGLLDACDRLGMLVLVENRLMGTSPGILKGVKRMVTADRNHPCVFAWSIGNEEWNIEGNEKGAAIASAMQAFVRRLDPTRLVTAAVDGGWGKGISTVLELMGYNYYEHGSTDQQHAAFPHQPSFGTEDSTTHQTRGIYDDSRYGHMAPSDLKPGGTSVETVWKYYVAHPYLAGLFLWTGFDYRGEETPFHYPAVCSQYGIFDLCGFPKDGYDYLKSWWTSAPVLYLSPHWNWKGREGKTIRVRAYSNCGAVELFLNGRSLGKKAMPVDSHLEWDVPYQPGTLSAVGFKDGKEAASAKEVTTGDPASVALSPDRDGIRADGQDVSVVTVEARDAGGRAVPTAENEVFFSLAGPGRIIGVGNGDPTCHEPDRYFDTVAQVPVTDLKMKDGFPASDKSWVEPGLDDSSWPVLFSGRPDDQGMVSKEAPRMRVVRGVFDLPNLSGYTEVTLLPKSLVDDQSVYVNGHLVAGGIGRDDAVKAYPLPKEILKAGRNTYAVVGKELLRRWTWENLNTDPGCLRTVIPAARWRRSLFSGKAEVIVQSERKPGEIVLKADSPGLKPALLRIRTRAVPLPPSVPSVPEKE